MAYIYLDANASTPLLPSVFEAMRPWLLASAANASSTHQPGQRARAAVDQARGKLARLLHCSPAELIFTSGGTESDNLALFGTLKTGDHLITATAEHHAILHAAEALEKRGVEVTYLPCNVHGLITPESLEQAIRANTRLVSILYANNETGVIQPIPALARIAKAHGALFHTDAVQAAAKLALDLSPGGPLGAVDLLSISGHKMYAPQGTGALFLRRKTSLAPMFHGGAHERQRRAGTENVPGIVALGHAAEEAYSWMNSDAPRQLGELRDHLEQTILQSISGSGSNGAQAARTPNTANMFFEGIDAEALLIALDLQGIGLSAGSACQSGATEPSHVLTAMGLSSARAKASVRISLSRNTTRDEIDRTLEVLASTVIRLRSI